MADSDGERREWLHKQYYDILLMGRTGKGKSTTGNRLLESEEGKETKLKVWTQAEEGAEEKFKPGSGIHSETEKCKLISNENNTVRVLDTPGFADSKQTKEHGLMSSNLHIFRSILLEQKKFKLAFRRILYFIPFRGPPDRADGTLQEEIYVMYDFLGQAMFNIMIIVATNYPDPRYQQIGFVKKDYDKVQEVFMLAYETTTGSTLPHCPPVLYLPVAPDPDLIAKILEAEVIFSTELKTDLIAIAKLDDKLRTDHTKGEMQVASPVERIVPVQITENTQNNITVIIERAKQEPEPEPLQFTRERCARCACKLMYDQAGKIHKVIYEDKSQVFIDESKCHPIFVPKHSFGKKFLGGLGHIATLGIAAKVAKRHGKESWPGFTNSDEICPVCEKYPGSVGCTPINTLLVVPKAEQKKLGRTIKTAHIAELDDID